jgi:hypothetical protein
MARHDADRGLIDGARPPIAPARHHDAPARLEHPEHLAQGATAIGEERDPAQAGHEIEGLGGEGQRLRRRPAQLDVAQA